MALVRVDTRGLVLHDFKDFASPKYPLHCSSLPYLLRCPARLAMIHALQMESEGGEAAHTGTGTHLGAHLWHEGKTLAQALKEVKSALPRDFPKADYKIIEKYLKAYTSDPRNAPEAVIQSEWKMTFSIPAHPLDPTKKVISLVGTCDQIRRTPRGYEIWDIKTGSDDGYTMLHEFTTQLCAYARGAQSGLDMPVYVGGIIRVRGYFNRERIKPENEPRGVFFNSPMDQDTCDLHLNRIRYIVAGIRRGEALFGAGKLCDNCPHGGVGMCGAEGRRLGLQVL